MYKRNNSRYKDKRKHTPKNTFKAFHIIRKDQFYQSCSNDLASYLCNPSKTSTIYTNTINGKLHNSSRYEFFSLYNENYSRNSY